MNKIAACIAGFCIVLLSLFLITPQQRDSIKPDKVLPPDPVPVQPAPQFPAKPNLTNSFPGYQDYAGVVRQLEEWKKQAPGLVETGVYGRSARGANLTYIRITNLLDSTPKKKVLITSCIHGNEPLSASTTMAFIGTMLANYTVDQEVTQLINTRDIYFVPVISPDSYPSSRHVDSVDPNRDFPGPTRPSHRSTPSVAAIQTLFQQHKFNAVISGHTYGRVYLIPYGDKTQLCPNNDDYVRIVGKMQGLSQYRRQRACEMYNRPIFGTEVDWYYRNGAFAIVCEYGTHQRIPSMADTKDEFNRTYKATLVFIKEAPLVNISSVSKLTDFRNPVTDLHEGTWFFRPAAAINVTDGIKNNRFGVMRMSAADDVTSPQLGKSDRLDLDVFRTTKIDLATILRHPRDVMRIIDPLQK